MCMCIYTRISLFKIFSARVSSFLIKFHFETVQWLKQDRRLPTVTYGVWVSVIQGWYGNLVAVDPREPGIFNPSKGCVPQPRDPRWQHQDFRQQDKRDKKITSCLLSKVPGSWYWCFCLYPIGQNCSTYPHWTAMENEECDLYFERPYLSSYKFYYCGRRREGRLEHEQQFLSHCTVPTSE